MLNSPACSSSISLDSETCLLLSTDTVVDSFLGLKNKSQVGGKNVIWSNSCGLVYFVGLYPCVSCEGST